MKIVESKKEESFVSWFNRMKRKERIRHFSAWEFTHYFERPLNHTPARELWMNIVPTLKVVDLLRDKIDEPIHIWSSYRSEIYNKKVGGAKYSQHKVFRALDIACYKVEARELFSFLMHWRMQGVFVGGLGKYPTFVHIDTRNKNATW